MRLLLTFLLMAMIAAEPAHAYIGPGLGLGTIGAFFGALLAGLLAVLGFFWYPIKRLLRKRKQQRKGIADAPRDADGP